MEPRQTLSPGQIEVVCENPQELGAKIIACDSEYRYLDPIIYWITNCQEMVYVFKALQPDQIISILNNTGDRLTSFIEANINLDLYLPT